MSVGRICDEDHTVTFDKFKAVVKSKDGAVLCTFERKHGKLYTAKMVLKCPKGFGRQE